MSGLTDAVSIFKEFKSDQEKQQFIEAQQRTILALMKETASLKDELEHLRDLLTSTSPLLEKPRTIIVSPEEALIDVQIGLLSLTSMQRELTLDETKKLDLLLKNKKLIKDQIVPQEKAKAPNKLDKKKLLALASKPFKEDENV